MLKLTGAVIVILSVGFTGITIANRYSRRLQELRSLLPALQMLETEITYAATLLPEALHLVALRCPEIIAPLFEKAAAELFSMSGFTVWEAWGKALEIFSHQSALNKADLAILHNLGGVLGISDRQDRSKHLCLAREQLKIQVEKAEEEAAKNVKLWNYLGFLGGLVVVLILY